MLILAIETAGQGGSVALLDDDRVARRLAIETSQSAQKLAPAIEQLLADHGVAPQQVKLIAVAAGPGSFTGLRVGVTTAKTLAYALGCDLIAVDTLDAIAAQAPESGAAGGAAQDLFVVMDAQRRELYAAQFGPAEDTASSATSPWQRRGANQIVPAATWLCGLAPGTLVTGPGLKRLTGQLPAGVSVVATERWAPDAVTVGRLALAAWQTGRRDDLWKLAPTYIRPSYAEEKAELNAECRVQNTE